MKVCVWRRRDASADPDFSIISVSLSADQLNTFHHSHQYLEGWGLLLGGHGAAGAPGSPFSPLGVKPFSTNTISGGSGRGLQPFARPPLMSSENLWARWREPDLRSAKRRRGGRGSAAAQIASDMNPENKVQQAGCAGRHRERSRPGGTSAWPKNPKHPRGPIAGLCSSPRWLLFHLLMQKSSFEIKVKGHYTKGLYFTIFTYTMINKCFF